MVTAEFLLKIFILLIVPILVVWGTMVLQQGRVTIQLQMLPQLTGRSARLTGVLALCEAAAGLSFVMGHTTSAVTMMALTLPLMFWIVTDRLTIA